MRVTRTSVFQHAPETLARYLDTHGARTRLVPPGHVSFEPVIGEDSVRATAHLGPGVLGKAQPTMVLERRDQKQSDACLAYIDAQVTGPFRLYRHEVEVLSVQGGAELRESIEYELPAGGARAEKALAPRIEALLRFREEQLQGDLALVAGPAHKAGKRIAIAGASGLIGTQVAALLEAAGHDVVRLTRPSSPDGGPSIPWDPHAGELEPEALAGVEAVVNLAGRSIGTRMTAKAKHEILSSRVASSQLLSRTVGELARAGEGPSVVVQASAVGYYGAKRPGEILGEDSAPGRDVLAQVCEAWEACLDEAREAGVRTVALRTGIVLSEMGGALAAQLPLFMLGLGGRLTAKESRMSWVGLDDMVRAYVHALSESSLEGPVNAVAPNPATAAEFAETLGRVLHRPSFLPVPSFGPRFVLGREGAEALVEADQWASAEKLLGSGFEPQYPVLEAALTHTLLKA